MYELVLIQADSSNSTDTLSMSTGVNGSFARRSIKKTWLETPVLSVSRTHQPFLISGCTRSDRGMVLKRYNKLILDGSINWCVYKPLWSYYYTVIRWVHIGRYILNVEIDEDNQYLWPERHSCWYLVLSTSLFRR